MLLVVADLFLLVYLLKRPLDISSLATQIQPTKSICRQAEQAFVRGLSVFFVGQRPPTHKNDNLKN
ncbi:MAG: hypothetical protein J6T33_05305 [Bacteroidales bacterium]|nr:hypothetical protein [Bacteroidales bacterium]